MYNFFHIFIDNYDNLYIYLIVKIFIIFYGTVMKTILGLIASPRTLGNCELIVKEIGNHITEKHELQLLRLQDFNIKPCRGCYTCLFGIKQCVIDDDYPQVISAIVNADALIIAVPTYSLGANATLKLFFDRCIASYSYVNQLWNKPCVSIGIAGINGMECSTRLDLEKFTSMMLFDNKATEILYSAIPGEVFMNEKNLKKAAALGRALFGERLHDNGPSCPICGGKSFRFLGEDRVKCLLCSQAGYISMESGSPVFDITKEYGIFLSKKEAQNHSKWLKGKRSEYKVKREYLNQIIQQYLDRGNWIKP